MRQTLLVVQRLLPLLWHTVLMVVEASKDDPLSLSVTEVFWRAGGGVPGR